MTDHKSEKIRLIGEENGWQSDIIPVMDEFEKTGRYEDIFFELYCLRGDETIKAVWKGDRFQESTYVYGHYRSHPARSGGVVKLLQAQPDPSKFAGSNNSERSPEVTYGQLTKIKNVPWDDPEEVRAFDVLVNVVGKSITWVRRTDGERITQACPKDSNLRKPYFRVKTTSQNKRVLEWCSPAGFHACYLEDIIDVS